MAGNAGEALTQMSSSTHGHRHYYFRQDDAIAISVGEQHKHYASSIKQCTRASQGRAGAPDMSSAPRADLLAKTSAY